MIICVHTIEVSSILSSPIISFERRKENDKSLCFDKFLSGRKMSDDEPRGKRRERKRNKVRKKRFFFFFVFLLQMFCLFIIIYGIVQQ